MRAYIGRLLGVILTFILLLVCVNVVGRKLTTKRLSERNVVVDRINDEIESEVSKETFKLDVMDAWPNDSVINVEKITDDVFYSKIDEWKSLYGEEACPEDVRIILFVNGDNDELESGKIEMGGEGSLILGIYNLERLIGVSEYKFADYVHTKIILLMNIAIAVCMLMALAYGIWIYRKVIIPFNRLSDYPERLSKGGFTEKLPESKNRFFGKYVWGMNMLSDKLENDRKAIRRISDEHQNLVTVLVHGIKTPAANIKLLAEAIATGLYDPEGKINEKDAELAGRIESNADEIERIVTEAVDTANAAIFDYDPEKKPFYRDELKDYIEEEYTNRLKVERIPFSVESEGNPLIDSDKDGICRILRQFMDNAIKYGDGTGITLRMDKTDEGHFITVINKGEPLPESELPFVFNSRWRGSNSSEVEGSGIGLYEARYIARHLGGDIRMRSGKGETEITLFLP
jgi:Signal transduction histidine kinase